MNGVESEFLSTRMVLVCDGCGKGFLAMPPGQVDCDPRWRVIHPREKIKESGICGGAVLAIDYQRAMRLAVKYERKGKIDV